MAPHVLLPKRVLQFTYIHTSFSDHYRYTNNKTFQILLNCRRRLAVRRATCLLELTTYNSNSIIITMELHSTLTNLKLMESNADSFSFQTETVTNSREVPIIIYASLFNYHYGRYTDWRRLAARLPHYLSSPIIIGFSSHFKRLSPASFSQAALLNPLPENVWCVLNDVQYIKLLARRTAIIFNEPTSWHAFIKVYKVKW